MILTAFTVLLFIAQPYRSKYNIYNTVTSAMFGFMILVMMGIMNANIALTKVHQLVTVSETITAILIMLPQLYFMRMAVKWMYTYKRKIFKKFLVSNHILERSQSDTPLLEVIANEQTTSIRNSIAPEPTSESIR